MEDSKYYAMFGSERRGPMTLDELRRCGITPTTPVWCPGMADWANASTLPELAGCFGPQQPPQSPQNAYQPYNQPQNQPQNQPYGQQNAYNQGYSQGGNNNMPPCPDNYLVWAIIVTVLCCLVGGIVALVYSSKVQTLYSQGDYEGALRASNNAKNWCIGSAVVGLVGSLLYGGLIFAGALSEIM